MIKFNILNIIFKKKQKEIIEKKPFKKRKEHRYKDKFAEIRLPEMPKELQVEYEKLIPIVNNTSISELVKMEYMYDFIDLFNAFVDTFSVCEEGCSACCMIQVDTTFMELEYIKYKTGIKFSVPQTIKDDIYYPCPFLNSNNSCSIYDARPIACRTFHAVHDPKYCQDFSDEHLVYGKGRGDGVPIYMEIAKIIDRYNKDYYDGRKGDLRQFFKDI